MEDHIAILEAQVADLQVRLANVAAKYFCLKRTFIGICSQLAVPILDDLRKGKEECCVSALWLTFPEVPPAESDRLGDIIRNEFDELYAGLIAVGEARKAGTWPPKSPSSE